MTFLPEEKIPSFLVVIGVGVAAGGVVSYLDGGDFLRSEISRGLPVIDIHDSVYGVSVEEVGKRVAGIHRNFHSDPGNFVGEFEIWFDFKVAPNFVQSDEVSVERSFVIGRNFNVVYQNPGFPGFIWK